MDKSLNLATRAEVDRVKSVQSVRTALQRHGDDMVIILAPQFDPELFAEPGAGKPEDVAKKFAVQVKDSTPRRLVDKSIAWLDRIEDDLLSRGRPYRTLKVFRLTASQELRRVAAKVVTAVSGVRDEVFAVYGEEAGVKLGFARITPTAPGDVMENSLHLEERLSHRLKLPEPAPGRLPIDLDAQLRALSVLFRELKRAIAEYQDLLRDSQQALIRRNRAIPVFDRTFRRLAGTVENLFELAGMPEEARLVRPASRRPGLTQAIADAQDLPSGTDDTGGDDTGGDETGGDDTGGPQPVAQLSGSPEGPETPSDGSSVATAASTEAPAEE